MSVFCCTWQDEVWRLIDPELEQKQKSRQSNFINAVRCAVRSASKLPEPVQKQLDFSDEVTPPDDWIVVDAERFRRIKVPQDGRCFWHCLHASRNMASWMAVPRPLSREVQKDPDQIPES